MGRDSSRFALMRDAIGFNSRARMGRDLNLALVECDRVVSIHAPAWGATPCLCPRWSRACRFNSRARMGRDFSNGYG